MNRSEIVSCAMASAADANPQSEPDYVDGFIAGAESALADALEAKEQREVVWLEYADFLHAEMQKLIGLHVAHGYTGDLEAFERGRRLRSALGIRGAGERPNLKKAAPISDRDPGDEAVRA